MTTQRHAQFARVPLLAAMDDRLAGRDWRVLLALLAHADDTLRCWPSRQRLALLTGLSVTKISDVVQRLREFGWVRTEGAGGRGRSLLYEITVPEHLCDKPTEAARNGPESGTVCEGKGPEPGGKTVPNLGIKRSRIRDPEQTNEQTIELHPPMSPQTDTDTELTSGSTEPPGTVDSKYPRGAGDHDKMETEMPRRKQHGAAAIELPEWMPADLWDLYLAHRRQARKPMTEIAQERAVAKLERLAHEGYDPRAVIEQTLEAGWLGLFPVRESSGGANHATNQRPGGPRSAAERFWADIEDALPPEWKQH